MHYFTSFLFNLVSNLLTIVDQFIFRPTTSRFSNLFRNFINLRLKWVAIHLTSFLFRFCFLYVSLHFFFALESLMIQSLSYIDDLRLLWGLSMRELTNICSAYVSTMDLLLSWLIHLIVMLGIRSLFVCLGMIFLPWRWIIWFVLIHIRKWIPRYLRWASKVVYVIRSIPYSFLLWQSLLM